MRKVGLVCALSTGLLLSVAATASAGPLYIRLDAGGGNFFEVFDGGAGDINPVEGAVTFSGSVGAFLINVTTGLSAPLIGGSQNAEIDLN
jgi:hypothetical protein